MPTRLKRKTEGKYFSWLIKMLLGVKRWRTKALEREEWASIIKEAKAKLKGP
jgi:hypothetical protein